MTGAEAMIVFRRITGIWSWSTPALEKAASAEWLDFLIGLEYEPALAAVVTLRGTQRFRPSMSELREQYDRSIKALEQSGRESAAVALLPGSKSDERDPYTLLDYYGSPQDAWVYCWRCCRAITLEERSTTAHYTPRVGFAHDHCPRSGSAPEMPVSERNEREAHWQRMGVELPAVRRSA